MNHPDIGVLTWRLADDIRQTAPLIHNITNLVVQNETAEAISAVGGTQITLHTEEEAAEAASACSAIAVNLGTLNTALLLCARTALGTAASLGRPWVLDPVAAGFTAYRTDAATEFLGLRPTVLKANASEVLSLAGGGEKGHGADSIHSVSHAAEAARRLAQRHGCVVAVTGPEDLVTDGERMATVANGRPLMGRMIGSGCMLTAVLGCFLSVAERPFEAALAALAYFDVAGELAADQAQGPGTFKPLLIDALYNLPESALHARLKVSLGG